MTDFITKEAAINAIEEYADRLQMLDWKENPGVPYKAYALNWCINTIRDLPSIQSEQKHGHWKDDKYGNMICSVCGGLAIQAMTGCLVDRHLAPYVSDYCPHCGAKMDGRR